MRLSYYHLINMKLSRHIYDSTFTQARDSLIVEPGEVLRLFVSKSVNDQEEESDCSWVPPEYNEVLGEKLDIDQGSLVEHNYPEAIDPFRPAGTWKYKWYGSDATTDCGIEINAAVESDHGSWICYFQGSLNINVIVPFPPKTTELKNDYPDEDDQEIMSLNTIEHNIPINISCISTNARPPPEVTWTLRGEEVRDNNLLFTMHDESNTFTTSIFIMSYRPKASDDGLRIGCSFQHISKVYSQIEENDALNSPSRYLTLSIKGPPDTDTFRFEFEKLEIGEVGIVKCVFHSNPPPRKGGVTWEVHDSDIPIEAVGLNERAYHRSGERYTSSLEKLDNNDYIAILTIQNLDHKDINKEIAINVNNDLGSGSKQVRVSKPDVALGGGAIAGITIAVIMIILLGLLGLYFYKKKRSGSYTSS
nr:uncharacterized protein LOC121125253 isoform X2 [Lepeophtheirus salmonis]